MNESRTEHIEPKSYKDTHPGYHELVIDKNLKLRTPSLNDAEASLTWVQDPEVIQHMGADFESPTLLGEQERIKEILRNDDAFNWTIEADGQPIGNINIADISKSSEVFGVKAGLLNILVGDKDWWQKGISTKASQAAISWAFNSGFETIGARALPQNSGSLALLNKLGFEPNGEEPFDQNTNWQKFKLDNANWQN